MADEELNRRAAAVVEANKYMVLGTVGDDGRPWVTPVYYTPDGHSDFYWASSPHSQHSRNLLKTPGVSIAIFDSSVPIGGASAVYLTANAGQVPDDELEASAEHYGSRFPEVRKYTAKELSAPNEIRLYRARATEHWILIPGRDPKYGKGLDSRLPVWD